MINRLSLKKSAEWKKNGVDAKYHFMRIREKEVVKCYHIEENFCKCLSFY